MQVNILKELNIMIEFFIKNDILYKNIAEAKFVYKKLKTLEK